MGIAPWLLLKSSNGNDARAQAGVTFITLQKWNRNLYINISDTMYCNYQHYFRARKNSTTQTFILNFWLDLT